MKAFINLFYEKRYSHKSYAYKVTALIILLYFAGGIISSVLQFSFFGNELNKEYSIYSQCILQIFILLLPTIYFAKRALLPYSILMRKKSEVNYQQIIAGIIGIIAFQAFVTGFMALQEKIIPDTFLTYYKDIEDSIESMYLLILGGSGYFDLARAMIIGALIPAIAEETLFRGFLQSSLEQEYNPAKAIVITALIFSFLHINPIGLIPLIGIGIYLGFVAFATNNLILPMLIHFINNALAIIIIYSPKLGEIENKTVKIPYYFALFLMLSGLFIVFLCCLIINKYSFLSDKNQK
ncbi:MAG: CPBP family intramembrane glutamic endopeptidase [bacterium]